MEKIAAHFNSTAQTVTEVLHRWQKLGLEGLWELPGRGGKTSWKEEDIVFLEECLEKEARTYNSLQLSQKLEQERQIKLSPDRLRRVLKKGIIWKRARKSHKGKQSPKAKEIKLFRPRYVDILGCHGRNRLEVFGRIRVLCLERAKLHILPKR